MGLLDFIGPASGLLFTLENILWINLGVFIGCVFAAIPGLSVILCIILFLPVTYTMSAIPGMMFLLGIYCAGGYGGSVSAILINTPGTPHAAATMLDGHPLSKQGRTSSSPICWRKPPGCSFSALSSAPWPSWSISAVSERATMPSPWRRQSSSGLCSALCWA